MDEYLLELRRLSKDCNFRSVSKTEHRDDFIRDVLINGILSHPVRQRLLEESTLTIDAAFQKARSLEIAQKNSESYICSGPCTSAAAVTQGEAKRASDQTISASAVHKIESSLFCGSKKPHIHKR